MNDSLFLHALNSVPGVGAVTLRSLIGHFGTAEQAWQADPNEWATLPGIGEKTIESFRECQKTFDFAKAEALFKEEGIEILGFGDKRFPELLSEIPSPPAILYVRGNTDAWEKHPLIAVVGSRKFSNYGKQVAYELSRALSQAGFTVVSGLAFGIDAIAHEAVLDAPGRTIAVLGSGNDDRTISPQSHLDLAHHIIEAGGAVITEFSPGTPGTAGTFPARNRLMAGMTVGTVVIEAAEDSGSLITANLALEFNRDVFSVPGSIFSPVSAGTNGLLKRGAKVVTGIQDILEELSMYVPSFQAEKDLSSLLEGMTPEEKELYSHVSHEPLHVDKIILTTTLETTRVNSLLTKLEMRGLVKNIGNLHYIRVS